MNFRNDSRMRFEPVFTQYAPYIGVVYQSELHRLIARQQRCQNNCTEWNALRPLFMGLNNPGLAPAPSVPRVERGLAKARQIKQGMMQNLLTGRIRLV